MTSEQTLFAELARTATEQRNPHSVNIDRAAVTEILETINTEDHLVPIAVRREIPYIAQAVEILVEAFRQGGRLFYVGAGTSGRLGVLDASECPPTYGAPPEMVQGLIAGGREAMFRAQEGAEDRPEEGAKALDAAGLRPGDVVCGIAASKRTPFVIGAVQYARARGCKTLYVTCTPRAAFDLEVDVAICAVVGPEVIMGSTRMKSGTAQKLILNMLSTAAMVRLGKVYENMMIDLQMTNAKLVERSKRIVMQVTGLGYDAAAALLEASGGHVKTALVMHFAAVEAAAARRLLDQSGGFVRDAIQMHRPSASQPA